MALQWVFIIVPTVAILTGIFLRRMSPNCNQGLSTGDPNSYSRPEECRVKKIHINWDVDFEITKLKGFVDLYLESKADGVRNSLVLDTRDLTIVSVVQLANNETGKALQYTLGEPIETFGSELEIKLDTSVESVRIFYETSSTSSALQWLKPEQTAGKKHPYLFSQCQAIHARSMLPCQDTPSVKVTYTANVNVPKELVALMSAVRDSEEVSGDQTRTIYKYTQKVPIPSYLIAIAVGSLVSRKIGPRSHVWAEKEFIEQSAFEFSETETMIETAESFLGPYVWGIYDLLVLPPSFPYGGMENPCLTFLTPTLLAGDRSLATVVAHEISHSWTGNLVTNANFEHFWLNEGFTRFVECKIVGKMNTEKHRHFCALEGWKDLQYAVDTLGADNPLTQLVVDLKGVDPDDAFSSVPYEKGQTLLFYLETLLGGNEIFEGFLRAYVEEFKFRSIDSQVFKDFLYRYFKDKHDTLNNVDWDSWFFKPGMPPVKPNYDTSLANACVELSQKWKNCNLDALNNFNADDIKGFSSSQIVEFLNLLLQEASVTKIPIQKLEKMTALYRFKENNNCEIRFSWLRLCLVSRWSEVVPLALSFVTQQGRMKYVRPLYRDLYAWEDTRALAIETFKKNRPGMMYVSAYTVSKDLKLE